MDLLNQFFPQIKMAFKGGQNGFTKKEKYGRRGGGAL
jgi:hypothetical protein